MAIKPLFFVGIFLILSSLSIAQTNSLLNEPFEHNARRWPELKAQNVNFEVKNGHYLIENNGASDVIAEKPFMVDDTKDFTLRCRFLQDRGMVKSRVGLVWGMKNYQEYHAFEVSPNGQFAVYSNVLGEFVMAKAWTDEPAITGRGDYNQLEIQKRNNDLTFLINGKQVYFRAFDGFYGSKIGFILSAGVTVRVDELVIEQEAKPIVMNTQLEYPNTKEKLGGGINSAYLEERPILADQGNTLFFVRAGNPENNGIRKRMDVWMSKMQGDGEWGEPSPVQSANSEHDDYLAGLSSDGNQLMIGSTEWSTTAFNVSIRLLEKKEANWYNPQDVSIPDFYTNTPEASYSLASDANILLLSVDRDDSFGGRDLYVSRKDADGNWRAPVNLGSAVNTKADEVSAFLAQDGKTLYFASQGWPGYGGTDVFVTERQDDTWTHWSEPRNLGASINTSGEEHHFFMPMEGEYAYFASSDEAKGEGDLYRIRIREVGKEPVVAVEKSNAIEGEKLEVTESTEQTASAKEMLWTTESEVKNPLTGEGIVATVKTVSVKSGKTVGEIETNLQGGFVLSVPLEDTYEILAEKPGYLGLPIIVQAGEELPSLDLLPVSADRTFQLGKLLFQVNKTELSEEGEINLDRLASLMMRYPELKLEVAGHTDNTGLETTNLRLSQNRAQSVAKYLQSKGVDSGRLVAAGFGENKPVVSNETEEGRSENRRVDFRILID